MLHNTHRHWPYFWLANGRLYTEDGQRAWERAPAFEHWQDAEAWLIAQDVPGNVRAYDPAVACFKLAA
jgi:hypothetical protein